MPQHLDGISLETDSQYIGMDAATRRNLEITQTLSGKKSPTLFSILDGCATHMGSRLLALWLHHPLRSRAHIRARQESVAALGSQYETLQGRLKTSRTSNASPPASPSATPARATSPPCATACLPCPKSNCPPRAAVS